MVNHQRMMVCDWCHELSTTMDHEAGDQEWLVLEHPHRTDLGDGHMSRALHDFCPLCKGEAMKDMLGVP